MRTEGGWGSITKQHTRGAKAQGSKGRGYRGTATIALMIVMIDALEFLLIFREASSLWVVRIADAFRTRVGFPSRAERRVRKEAMIR